MRTRTANNKKQRKHEMLLTFLDSAYTGRKKRKKTSAAGLRHAILLLLGTV
ncbi:MAG TPA: hypothetical protein VEB40_12470 [Flavipsychrobacter sp.]|nr:hypothetical protein [Flavipsychrobacter sp.]